MTYRIVRKFLLTVRSRFQEKEELITLANYA